MSVKLLSKYQTSDLFLKIINIVKIKSYQVTSYMKIHSRNKKFFRFR
jgi:hypothetical protein